VIVLVRHGRTSLNAHGLLQGRVDEPLDELGRRQIETVATRLATQLEVAAIVSSPLARAQQSAGILADRLGHPDPVEIDERWIELDYGVLDTQPVGTVPASVWESWRTDPDFAPEGGESFGSLDARVHSACEQWATQAAGADIIVVSHVSPIKSAVAWALGAHPSIAHRSRLGQAAVCRIDIGRAGPTLVSFNEPL
jgi:broad specificity phosphatase PhoE